MSPNPAHAPEVPLVTIVMPTRNRADLLARALRSALAQTYPNIEVVVVDDASTDHTNEVVAEMGDARVRYVRHEMRRGVSAARNTGVALAGGEFVSFLDDDDEYPLDRTETLLRALAASPERTGLAYAKAEIVVRGRRSHLYPETGKSGKIYLDYLSGRRFQANSTLFRRSALPLFDEALFQLDFSDLLLRVLNHYEAVFVDVIGLRSHDERGRQRQSANLEVLRPALAVQEKRHLPGAPRTVRAGFYTSVGIYSLRGNTRNRVTIYCFARAFVLSPTPWNLARLVASLLGTRWVERYHASALAIRRLFTLGQSMTDEGGSGGSSSSSS